MPTEATPDDQAATLAGLVSRHRLLGAVLERWPSIQLPDAWLSGSAIAQAVWNNVFGFPAGHGIADIDIVYFDAADLSEAGELAHAERIGHNLADLPIRIDLKNQARVHLWYEARFGYPIRPYRSTAEAIATFPTTAAAVGIRPAPSAALDIVAPFGLSDLLAPIVRPNPVQITREIYERKTGRWRAFWSRLEMLPWSDAPARPEPPWTGETGAPPYPG